MTEYIYDPDAICSGNRSGRRKASYCQRCGNLLSILEDSHGICEDCRGLLEKEKGKDKDSEGQPIK